MKNKILILGRGYIGERLKKELKAGLSGKKIRSFKDADREIARYSPKILVNCIGHTGARNVDGCELERDKTLLANTFIPQILAEVALRRGIKLVHISSGCIFHYDYAGDRPLSEDKTPDFFDLFYSRSKIYAERALEVLSNRYNILIARIRIPLDDRPHPKNILTKLLSYRKVIDLPNSVTYIPDFVKALKHLIRIDAKGVYNVVNEGGLRYPEFLDVYKKYVPGFRYQVVDYKKLGLVRTNVLLSVKKLQRTGFKMRPVREVYEECVKNYLRY